jgi:oligopeptide/dipeptide ABC transporter ATP-binding protein
MTALATATASDGIAIRDLSIAYRVGRTQLLAVELASLSIEPGKITAVVGESGSGKSTLARAILGLPPAKVVGGSVMFEGTDLVRLGEKRLRDIRGRRISMIFQNPTTSMNPLLTIRRQVADSYLAHFPRASEDEVNERVRGVLAKLGIPERRLDAYPHELSGGMTQRVMIGMGLICGSDFVIADEPTTALDVLVEYGFMAQIHELCRRDGVGVLLVSHNMGLVAMWADSVAIMYGGRIMEFGQVAEVLEDPQHPYSRALVGATPSLSRELGELTRLPGAPANLGMQPPGCPFHPRCPVAAPICAERKPRVTELGRVGEPSHTVACLRYEPDAAPAFEPLEEDG